jgi:hypothetical protein
VFGRVYHGPLFLLAKKTNVEAKEGLPPAVIRRKRDRQIIFLNRSPLTEEKGTDTMVPVKRRCQEPGEIIRLSLYVTCPFTTTARFISGGLKPAPTFFKKIFDFACPHDAY